MDVFLDANVLFSASDPASPTAELFQRIRSRTRAVTCDYAIEEVRRNIEQKRPELASNWELLAQQIHLVPTIVYALPIKLEKYDMPILCSAIRAKCSYLVTGDRKHFGQFYDQNVYGVTIVSLGRITEILSEMYSIDP